MKDRWYVAVFVLHSEVYAPVADAPLFDHQVRLIRASDAEAAYERALFLGRGEEHSYRNADGQEVRWKFLGLHDLVELETEPEDGSELYSFLRDAQGAFEVMPKDKLTVFYVRSMPDQPASQLLE